MKKRLFRNLKNILTISVTAIVIVASSILPSFADDEFLRIPFSEVIKSGESLSKLASNISFDCDEYMVGASSSVHNVSISNNVVAVAVPSPRPGATPAPHIKEGASNFRALYSARHNRYNFFGFCPKDGSISSEDCFVFQANTHYILSFDLEHDFQGDEYNPRSLYFAFYDLKYVDMSDDPLKGTQLYARLYEASSVSPLGNGRTRYTFDFAFTQDEITQDRCFGFGLVMSDTSSVVNTRSGYLYFYNWDCKVLDNEKYLIYRLSNPDTTMSQKVNEAAQIDKAIDSLADDLIGVPKNPGDPASGVSKDLADSGAFSASHMNFLTTNLSKAAAFGKTWLQDIFSVNQAVNVWSLTILIVLTFGLFRFFYG